MIGRRDFFYSCPLSFFHTHASLLSVFVCLIVLFYSCCSHVWVFGKTLLYEFPVSYSHTEWYFLLSLFGARECKRPADTIIGFVPEVAVKNHLIKIKSRGTGTAQKDWGDCQSIGPTISDDIIRSWLWSTENRSCPLQYFRCGQHSRFVMLGPH